nr:MAG: RNA-dependent RNA polymerase [Hangzhou fiers-like virus 4]
MLPGDLERIVRRLFRDVDTPLSSRGLQALEQPERLVDFLKTRVDPRAYTSSEAYFKDALVVSFLKKCADLRLPGVDRVRSAREIWLNAERRNALTNTRFSRFNNGQVLPHEAASWEILKLVQKEFRKLMGRAPSRLEGSRFGPGATLSDRGRLTTVPDKMTTRPSVSSGARCLLGFWQETAWFRALCADRPHSTDPLTVDHERFLTVRKDAFKDRGICVGPSVNVYFQLGVGSFIRRKRLDRVGIVLEEAQDVHKRVACEASLSGAHATVDCSSASDLNASQMIRFLCDDDWWLLLNALRTTHTQMRWGSDLGIPRPAAKVGRPGGQVFWHVQKFSAMGNGYTFELETCVFLAAGLAACRLAGIPAEYGREVLVYGDDIIVPTGAAKALMHILDLLGHIPNESKTFVDGPFRESCGGDFFHGVAVRPYHLKEFPSEPQDWIGLANGLRRMAAGSPRELSRWSYLRSSWFAVLDQIPSHIRKCRGPESLGDIVIHDDREHWSRGRAVNWIGSLQVYSPFRRALDWSNWTSQVQLAAALYGVGSEGPLPRGSEGSYSLRWIPFSG